MKFGLSLTCVLFLALAVQNVNAAEPAKATTDELPAALKAVNGDAGKALTTNEAGAIRGESWGWGWSFMNGGPFALSNNFGIQNFGGEVGILGAKGVVIGSKNKFGVKAQVIGHLPF